MPLAEVALRAGYTDPSNFHRAFLSLTGMTPGQTPHEVEVGCADWLTTGRERAVGSVCAPKHGGKRALASNRRRAVPIPAKSPAKAAALSLTDRIADDPLCSRQIPDRSRPRPLSGLRPGPVLRDMPAIRSTAAPCGTTMTDYRNPPISPSAWPLTLSGCMRQTDSARNSEPFPRNSRHDRSDPESRFESFLVPDIRWIGYSSFKSDFDV